MPYCPKCNTEYVDGITECSDCHVLLIESQKDLFVPSVFLVSAETDLAMRIKEFLGYSGIDVTMDFDKQADLFDINVAQDQLEKADNLLKLLLANEAINVIDEKQAKENEKAQKPPMEHAYVSAKDRYEDMHSSAVSLLVVGIFVVVLILFSFTGYLPIPILGRNNLFGSIIMLGIGIFCIIGGISSFKQAKSLKSGIQIEDTHTQKISKWFLSTYTANQIDTLIKASSPDEYHQKEILSLRRMELIKTFIKREYDDIEDDYIDALAEELYEQIYEN